MKHQKSGREITKQKVALVLSGGGARGIAHIGVIEVLEEQGFEISSVSGTSMGAVVGGVYALGKLEEYKKWLCTLDKLKVFSLVDFSFSTQGLVKGDKLFSITKEFIGDANIEDLRIPFAAVAADIINRKEVVFTKGSAFDAVRASIAIPTIFTPVKTETGLLVDGGIINNIPINHVKRTPGDILVVVDVNADVPPDKTIHPKNGSEAKQSIYQKKIKAFFSQLYTVSPVNNAEEKLGYFNVINKTLSLMTYYNTQLLMEKYSPDMLINVSRQACSGYDFYRGEEMVETGRHAAAKGIEEYKPKIV
ncbi:MAG: patatin-like phospholipase family protein [Mucilaginibacter sp.]